MTVAASAICARARARIRATQYTCERATVYNIISFMNILVLSHFVCDEFEFVYTYMNFVLTTFDYVRARSAQMHLNYIS